MLRVKLCQIENNFTQAQCNGQSLVYVWFSFHGLSYRHNCHKPYGFLRIIRGANHSLTGGYMDPDPTPLPRWRNNPFR
ncbi:mgtA regulatory leader peptide MgtL [Citrobacter portucalensis]|uniref:mgtA regulatory leader peptide MgtL n=1 Tax=Citrobacter portucalensis TaxID=1639133 RepID=UPI00397C1BEB